jgi:hypothetical protein
MSVRLATIQIKQSLANVIAEEAKAKGISIDEYLESLLGLKGEAQIALSEGPSFDEFKEAMEAFSEGTEHLPASGIAYSREDIYFDHD